MVCFTFKKDKIKNKCEGFSLIEVLVSLSIFTIVVTISVSALLALITANSYARNSQSIITNLSFALDSMTREIRTGSEYYCATSVADLPVDGTDVADCVNGGNYFSFNEGGQSLTGNTPNDSRRISYRFQNGVIQRRLGNGDGSGSVNGDADWLDVTDEDIRIEYFQFFVTGSERGDDDTPVVTIYLSGATNTGGDTDANFNIQTTISQRLLDI